MNMDISQAKPISDSNIGQFGGGAIGESTPFVPNEGIESGLFNNLLTLLVERLH